MIKFILVACSDESGDDYRREVEWPVLPRQGEMVDIAGDMAPVSQVYHSNIDKDPCIQVHCNINGATEKIVKDNPKWKRAGL